MTKKQKLDAIVIKSLVTAGQGDWASITQVYHVAVKNKDFWKLAGKPPKGDNEVLAGMRVVRQILDRKLGLTPRRRFA